MCGAAVGGMGVAKFTHAQVRVVILLRTPPPQFAAWVDAVVFVFSLEDEISFQTVYNYFLRLCSFRNTSEVPMVLVGTQGERACSLGRRGGCGSPWAGVRKPGPYPLCPPGADPALPMGHPHTPTPSRRLLSAPYMLGCPSGCDPAVLVMAVSCCTL